MNQGSIFDINRKRKSSFIYATILWAIVIMWLSLSPSSSIPKVKIVKIPHLDKYVHATMYFILTVLALSMRHFKGFVVNKYLLLTYCLFYGILMELLQNIMKMGRNLDYYDIFANLMGIILGFLIFENVLKSLSLWKLH